jgi:predicted deacylase
VADGKPTILVEIGENGRRDPAFVEPIVAGVENLLRVLEMTTGSASPPRADTRWFDGTASANAAVTGIFTPAKTQGRMVRKDEAIGAVRDYAGQVLELIVSPVDGYVMYGLAGPPVRAGESVATIALPAKGPL